MPSPQAIIPVLEGMVSTMATGAAGRQEVGQWVEMCKSVLRSPTIRDLTNLQFVAAADVDESANVIDTAATGFLAILVGTNSADAEIDWVSCYDADSGTFDGTAALANTQFLTVSVPLAATDGTEQYTGVVLPSIFALATGLSVGADGQDGTNPALDDLRAWILYQA